MEWVGCLGRCEPASIEATARPRGAHGRRVLLLHDAWGMHQAYIAAPTCTFSPSPELSCDLATCHRRLVPRPPIPKGTTRSSLLAHHTCSVPLTGLDGPDRAHSHSHESPRHSTAGLGAYRLSCSLAFATKGTHSCPALSRTKPSSILTARCRLRTIDGPWFKASGGVVWPQTCSSLAWLSCHISDQSTLLHVTGVSRSTTIFGADLLETARADESPLTHLRISYPRPTSSVCCALNAFPLTHTLLLRFPRGSSCSHTKFFFFFFGPGVKGCCTSADVWISVCKARLAAEGTGVGLISTNF
ncbi:hypothetical protein B0H67DRAFT_96040 [Lasiosphaeris hirsuta]|uniref:Uncharacterized protein n=1 Tax=Lasiosphaeris hirsuta TaxID=260670 RepID=A0AA40ECD1_9PEZI|nr:hypothetical protein B0H67DRAFT_96040 [Lasiosphaeris hirsuta]